MSHFSVVFFAVLLLLAHAYPASNRKALMLHEQNIDHGEIFKWWSRGSRCAH